MQKKSSEFKEVYLRFFGRKLNFSSFVFRLSSFVFRLSSFVILLFFCSGCGRIWGGITWYNNQAPQNSSNNSSMVWAATNGTVYATAMDAAGNLYVGGQFSTVYPYSAPNAMKLNPADGSPASGFNLQGGFNGRLNAMVELPDGSWIVGGLFTSYQGRTTNYIAKMDPPNWTLDTTFDPAGTGFNSGVYSLALDGAGNIYVGGQFTSYRGSTANYIAKMDTTNGTLNGVFDPAGTGFNNQVLSLVLDGAGNIYVGGFFNFYRGSSANNIAKMDTANGTLNGVFDPAGTGFNSTVTSLALDGAGNIYAGGAFSTYQGTVANNIVKLDASNWTLDTTFDPTGTGFNNLVYSLVLDGAGNIYVGGQFTTYRGSTANHVAKMDTTNGTLNGAFDPAGTGFDSWVQSLALDGLGNIYAGGGFTTYRGSAANGIAKMDTTNGTLNGVFDTLGTGFNSGVYTLSLDGLGNIYVGGQFTAYRGSTANYIAKMDTTNGTLNGVFDPAGTGFSSLVYSLVLDGLGNIYAGGWFLTYQGSTANHIAKMDTTNGTLNGVFDPAGTGFNTVVESLALDGLGNIYAGGGFTTYRGSTANYIAKMDTTNGTLNGVFDPGGTGFSSLVYSLTLDGAGNIYVGGSFSTYQGNVADSLVPLNATTGVILP